MGLLPVLAREQIAPELHPLWDECAKSYPTFANLWGTMAHSPTIFRHIWGGLLELKRQSPVTARQFELAIVVISALNRCRYCVSHHTPFAREAGLGDAQLEDLARLELEALPEDYAFPTRPGFAPDDSLVVDLAYLVVWAGIYPHVAGVPPHVVHRLRRRLFERLRARLSPRQIEELLWRITQCVAFNWHNDFLEIDIEPMVTPLPVGTAASTP